MVFAALLVVGLGLLIGLALLPTVVNVSSGTDLGPNSSAVYVPNPNPTVYTAHPVVYNGSSLNTLAAGTPLLDIVHLLGICFIGIIVLGAIWVVGKRA